MKALIFSRFCLVAVLVLGLLVVWSVATPHQRCADRIIAGGCDTDHNTNCIPIDPEKRCRAVHIICDGDGGKDCFSINLSCFGSNCQSAWDYACL